MYSAANLLSFIPSLDVEEYMNAIHLYDFGFYAYLATERRRRQMADIDMRSNA